MMKWVYWIFDWTVTTMVKDLADTNNHLRYFYQQNIKIYLKA